MKQIENNVFRSFTDDRMVIDVVAPLCNVSSVEVLSKDFTSRNKKFVDYNVTVKASVLTWKATDQHAKAALVGYDKEAGDIKHVIEIREDYDVRTATWKYRDGIIRVTIMKFDAAVAVEAEGGLEVPPVLEA